jgi:hypothetical protein
VGLSCSIEIDLYLVAVGDNNGYYTAVRDDGLTLVTLSLKHLLV